MVSSLCIPIGYVRFCEVVEYTLTFFGLVLLFYNKEKIDRLSLLVQTSLSTTSILLYLSRV